ncbi:tRNA pseudouridine(55) synthase TruB [Sulfodiicoccus acidiphilus]|uniref:tRNA pseudouridine(55) synthase TruB n=1 Tax=Sulfodiicoccus acidiphilus TaxID=1670455 RepID=A0A348B176_9CREN|nr:RNA-guided pseudouridylation complex pseudouridine synthase subunit Cbf5 [Sulfodiicoccus acidiphilus]BBD71928.1 tRNA pseudouridine(55) synthase TruB [Sulfodiicoccus acidiphilus]GGT91525.1 tRNA pseudouridine(55) synthase TruB [Sulfodiicoccus acidiphilus]
MSGVLPISLENATKLNVFLTNNDKEYICLMQLHGQVERKRLLEVLEEFRGRVYQRPPVRSSVKRRLRVREVREIELLDAKDRLVLMRVSSDAGTYMRKLCHDMGLVLGVGAHMRELRRTRSGIFHEKHAVTLHQLSEAIFLWRRCEREDELKRMLTPTEFGTCGMPKIIASNGAVDSLTHGAPLMAPGVLAYQKFLEGERVAIITNKGELIAISTALVDSDTLSYMEKGIVAKIERVFMESGVYPKFRKGN